MSQFESLPKLHKNALVILLSLMSYQYSFANLNLKQAIRHKNTSGRNIVATRSSFTKISPSLQKSCERVFESLLFQPSPVSRNGELQQIQATGVNKYSNNSNDVMHVDLQKIDKFNASWELTRHGVGKLLSELHGMENVLYYIMTAMLAKEHVIVDGAGGGAKTLAFRKTYEAQLAAVNKMTSKEQKEFYKDSYEFLNEFIDVLKKDERMNQPQYRIFTQQMHAILSETKILGGPDPFKFIEKGEYEIDYSKALIHQKNMFAILDEIEKAPVTIQMTLLSILNERQALVGNRVIQTMLESVAATTNKTLDELISQALPHEIGGRKAFLDRFNLKVHVLNSSADPADLFLLLKKIDVGVGENPYTMIDLRGLRPLLEQIQIPEQVLGAMTEISVHLDRKYTEKYVKAQEEVLGKPLPVPFYPAFSGSNRSQAKVIGLWKSAFLARQLLLGMPFERRRLAMGPADLVDLAPALLQGSRDFFTPELGIKVPFILLGRDSSDLSQSSIALITSNSQLASFKNRYLSEGNYDPKTGIFRYVSIAPGNPVRQFYFDAKTSKIHFTDPMTKLEIVTDSNLPALMQVSDNVKKHFGDLEKTLAYIHRKIESGQIKQYQDQYSTLQYEDQNWLGNYLNEAPLRRSTKKQLAIIKDMQDDFKNIVNAKIRELDHVRLSKVQDHGLIAELQQLEQSSVRNNENIQLYATSNRESKKDDVSTQSIRLVFNELTKKFLGTESTIKSMLLAFINRNNIMIFGPPGSAKTMLSRMMMDSALSGVKESQLIQKNKQLADLLLRQGQKDKGIWIRQFHPMSNEGDILGRIDLKKLREGHGYTYNRSGTLSAKDVFFALLDEFEKAPPGVRTALLSLLNEREVMDGDEVISSNLISVIITTNSTPSEFMQSQGDFSTAFPVFDRIQNKAYALNKLTESELKEFHRRLYLGVQLQLKAHLYLEPIWKLKKEFKIDDDEKMLLSRIHQKFMKVIVDLSEASIEAFESDPSSNPDYFMNSRGESNRSAQSVILKEFSGNVILNRILEGQDIYDIRNTDFRFDLSDLESFAELYLTSNPFYRITRSFDSTHRIEFKIVEKDPAEYMDRLDLRERKTMEFFKMEAENFLEVLNSQVQDFFNTRLQLIAKHPNLYPSAFASKEDKINYLIKSGIKEEDIQIDDLED